MASQFQSVQKWKYDAFLNFRREDCNESFVTNLYKHLEGIGIKAFKHDFEFESEEQISTEILEAIEESRTAITIFSDTYASSTRCLEELTKIMECVDSNGLESVSILYHTTISLIIDRLSAEHGAYGSNGSYLADMQKRKDVLCKAFDIAGFKKDNDPFQYIHQ